MKAPPPLPNLSISNGIPDLFLSIKKKKNLSFYKPDLSLPALDEDSWQMRTGDHLNKHYTKVRRDLGTAPSPSGTMEQ